MASRVDDQLAACGDRADVLVYVRLCEHLLRRQSEKLHQLTYSDQTASAKQLITFAVEALGGLLDAEGVDRA